MALLLLLLLLLPLSCCNVTPDPPLIGTHTTPLALWTLIDDTGAIVGDATVPGDLVSDLVRMGVLARDPLHDEDWLAAAATWWERTWTYETRVAVDADARALLVLDGVKMGAYVYVDGVRVGSVANQFVRSTFPLAPGVTHSVWVVFPAKRNNTTGIRTDRFAICSGGWDWAPVQTQFDESGRRLGTRGLWKHAYVVQTTSLFVTAVAPVVYAAGAPGQFLVNVTVFVDAPQAGLVDVSTQWGQSATLSISAGQVSASALFAVTTPTVALWRPAERANALYDVTVAVRGGSKLVRRVGFRTVALITHRQSATHNATGDWTMRVAINGAPVFLRGGSWVPSSFYEAQVNDANLVAAVESAAAAGFNALRIWGGGVYQYESFYDACDRLGIVLWHDMMLSSPGRNQPSLDPPDMTEEATYQARRLSSHASVVVWDACNECAFMPDFFRASQSALQALVREDLSRIVWPASPSLGWVSGVDPATSLPLYWNVKLVPQPWSGPPPRDHHGPYVYGSGIPNVNDPSGNATRFAPETPPTFGAPGSVGVGFNGSIVSEFGAAVMSSSWSMDTLLSAELRSFGSTAMFQRNWPCAELLVVYFGSASSVGAWDEALYACMVAQAMHMQGLIAAVRAQNNWSALIWQVNEFWPTGGWGSLETARGVGGPPGNVLGGRWKPLHYALADWLFGDWFVSCNAACTCFARRDSADDASPSEMRVTLSLLDCVTGAVHVVWDKPLSLEPFSLVSFSLAPSWSALAARVGVPLTQCVLRVALDAAPVGHVLLSPPWALIRAPRVPLQLDLSQWPQVTVRAGNATALSVWVSARDGQADQGFFTLLPHEARTLRWVQWDNATLAQSTIRAYSMP